MILDQHEIAYLEAGVDAARGIRDDERLNAELSQHIDRIGDLVRRIALVAVQTALHADNAAARERAADQTACMVGRGRDTEMRDIAIRDADRLLDLLRERAEARAEDDADLRDERQLSAQEIRRLLYFIMCQHGLSLLTGGSGCCPCGAAPQPLPFRCRWS